MIQAANNRECHCQFCFPTLPSLHFIWF